MKTWIKKLAYKIPRLKELREEVEFLKKENQNLCEGINKEQTANQFLGFRADELDHLHEELVLRNWGAIDSRKELFCTSPFSRIELLPNGDIYTCCSTTLKHGFCIGNIFQNSMQEIWNSESAKKLRYSVSEGDFEYCNTRCNWLHIKPDENNKSISPLRLRNEQSNHYETYKECIMQQGPTQIALSCDETCNLSCPSCREKTSVLSMSESDLLYDMLVQKIRPLLIDCDHLSALGSGDLFASKAMTKFYQTLNKEDFPNLRLLIITNAQLLTKKCWDTLKNLDGMPLELVISVDAATKKTYEKIRRGGSWEILNQNLQEIKKRRENGQIANLQMNFLVQEDNEKELEDFVTWCKLWNTDRIHFQRMANWGSYTKNDFEKKDILSPDHIKQKEIKDRIHTILLKDSGIEIIQNIC